MSQQFSNSDICTMTIQELLDAFASNSLTSETVVLAYKTAYETDEALGADVRLHAYVEFFADALVMAQKADAERVSFNALEATCRAEAFRKKPLLGVPFAVKDNISVKGKALTCGSSILEKYVAPYNATVVQRLLDAGAIPLGRTNMDEFAMGSSTEYSCYGPTRNPVNRDYAPGGSSGGSAAAVAGGQAPFALGTETGGSVRLPASYCGVYGLKPTYGVLSRWGLVAFGSSLDQVGLFGKTPEDIRRPLSVMAGLDFYDDTSLDVEQSELWRTHCDFFLGECPSSAGGDDISTLKIAIPRQFAETKGLDADVCRVFEEAKQWFVDQGASVDIVDLPILDASIACYYVIALSEAASNLSRFDGIRYGNRKDEGEGFDELYTLTRSEGFGAEVKRRIIIGNYVLSSNFSGDCYQKAMAVRSRMQREVASLFKSYDIVLCPTCPTPAFRLGEKTNDPLAMYLTDMFTIFVNLSRIPSLSMPAGFTTESSLGPAGLPIGVQIAGDHCSDLQLLKIAEKWHKRQEAGN